MSDAGLQLRDRTEAFREVERACTEEGWQRRWPGLKSAAYGSDVYDKVLAELCEELFGSLPRSDQRRKGIQYLRGLLEVEGRKSIRNIAATLGRKGAEQSLHHFISSSTWDWMPVRHSLARYLSRITAPSAWVVRRLIIPKAGAHSVGVDRRYIPALGQVLNAQQAVGVWAASDEMSVPVNWRLWLSKAWTDDTTRRSEALIPEDLSEETLANCAVTAVLELLTARDLPARPIVVDVRDADVVTVVRVLRAAGLPLMVRISGALPLVLTEQLLPGYGGDTLPAHLIFRAFRQMRRPVSWTGEEGVLRTRMAAAIRVALPDPAAGGEQTRQPARDSELLLLGAAPLGRRSSAELWLTDLTDAPLGALIRLAKLGERVDRDCLEVADQVGIRDFVGRSFQGWHRHITLASAAHAVALLSWPYGGGLGNVS